MGGCCGEKSFLSKSKFRCEVVVRGDGADLLQIRTESLQQGIGKSGGG